jgi:methionyl-tRNA formyltransferase
MCAELSEPDVKNEKWGSILKVEKDSIIVSCGTGNLRILELQFENEKRMSVEAYLRGHEIKEGTILGLE